MTELLVILVLVLINGLFSGAEIALLSVRKTRVAELTEQGRFGAKWVADLRAHPERLLATVQIGITVVGSTAAAFGGSTLAGHLAEVLRPALGPQADEVAFAAVVGAVSFLSLVLGELVPKSLALRAAEPYALLVAPFLAAVAWVARPLVWVLTGASNVVLRLFGDHTSFLESRLSQDELRQLVDEAATAGTVNEHAGEIASRALAFSELSVEDVLVPRQKIVSLPLTASVDDLAGLTRQIPHSRVLVYRQDPDDLVGYVTIRDVLAEARQGPTTLADHLHPMTFVPTTMPAIALLRDLQGRATHLAAVVDEQGTLRGLVSLEDLVEELVGNILSEGEAPSQEVLAEPDGTWLCLGSAPVREIHRVTGWEIPEGEASTTLAGLLLEQAGRIPETGERFRVGDYEAEVVEASRRKIKRIRLRKR